MGINKVTVSEIHCAFCLFILIGLFTGVYMFGIKTFIYDLTSIAPCERNYELLHIQLCYYILFTLYFIDLNGNYCSFLYLTCYCKEVMQDHSYKAYQDQAFQKIGAWSQAPNIV